MHSITWLRRSCLATIHELGITLPEGEHLYSNWDTELVGRRIVEDELPELYPLDENIQEAIDNLQENPIFLLSDRAQEPLSVEQINYVIDCPLYPFTSERGIGNLINVHELTPEQADKIILCDGVLEVRHFNTINFNGDARYYICCNKITNNNEFFQHYYYTINSTRPINWEYMMDLLTYGFYPN
ncbi:hypothetical protein EYC84_002875 [Monilinia fructicola]|uniref:Uncharacterized protein n=1 Tax=Monilinia fructicola TaxID=38448 RepID=A0A5M9JVV9_MONFR|nr:hypothetical protein EYC84_002875 [Monilinia fructicola]